MVRFFTTSNRAQSIHSLISIKPRLKMTSGARIRHQERVYVRAVTIGTKLEHERVTKDVVKSALLAARNGDNTKITIEK